MLNETTPEAQAQALISSEEFVARVEKLRGELPLFNTLMTQLGSFDKLAPHLQADACRRMGIVKADGYRLAKVEG